MWFAVLHLTHTHTHATHTHRSIKAELERANKEITFLRTADGEGGGADEGEEGVGLSVEGLGARDKEQVCARVCVCTRVCVTNASCACLLCFTLSLCIYLCLSLSLPPTFSSPLLSIPPPVPSPSSFHRCVLIFPALRGLI